MRQVLVLLWVGVLLAAGAVACSRGDAPEIERASVPTGVVLEASQLGTIERLHTAGGILLASQPSPADFAQAATEGVKTVINLRHSAETADFDEKRIVDAEGLTYLHLPFRDPAELTDAVFDTSREYLATAERPILLHCSSANRVGAVWLPYRVLDGGLSYDEALAEAKIVGLRSDDFEAKAREYIEKQ